MTIPNPDFKLVSIVKEGSDINRLLIRTEPHLTDEILEKFHEIFEPPVRFSIQIERVDQFLCLSELRGKSINPALFNALKRDFADAARRLAIEKENVKLGTEAAWEHYSKLSGIPVEDL